MRTTTNITIRDYCDDGGGLAIAHRAECHRVHRSAWHEQGFAPGYHVSDDRYPGFSLRRAITAFRRRWTVPVDVRLCDCTDRLTMTPAHGAMVDYHGSIPERHGRYRVEAGCDCTHCLDAEDEYGTRAPVRWVLAARDVSGALVRVEHVRTTSMTVVALPVSDTAEPPLPRWD